MVSDLQRQQRAQNLPENISGLYFSIESGDIMLNTFNKHLPDQTTFDAYIAYGTSIGDTILGFYKTNELPGLLVREVGVTTEVAAQIVADLKDFMQPVYERETLAAGQKQTDLKALHEQMVANPSPTMPVFSGKEIPVPMGENADTDSNTSGQRHAIPQSPTSPLDVVPMRTMAGDMSRVHGYGAFREEQPLSDDETTVQTSQADLLQR